ncbi:response regulator transcription factor [Paenibacillus pasadenensis]|uniref:Heme response regulator HssR n=1 Tax=Paenibacillus pasadenensis TaxID=217090 RepID=A0A2N5N4U5_9BACL|nr:MULTISPECIES: response regulator transcription factor [Paenibacillus]PLT45309.1 Phosphate regulon transcriptional regulatory protein PhoB (SphR) [Paenibacillus pasadenensis]QGG55706.1 response regulator [Paenibacillus sp. B01]
MPHLLIVDDDRHIRELVVHFMAKEGFDTTEAASGSEALARLEDRPADLVILDLMMPGMDGWELCRRLREDSRELPLLMLTAKGETMHKVKGFELGTDDYVVKPFDPPELVARVKALLKRSRIASSRQVKAGAVTLDRETYTCRIGGREDTLPRKEFELLFRLASYPGRTLPREQLLEQIWGYDYEGDERTLDTHIKRLRDRLADGSGVEIRTIRGLGYRLEERP